MELSPTNISVDVLVMSLYLLAVWRAVWAIYYNDLNIRDKIYLFLFVVVSLIYCLQTTIQVITGQTAIVWLWDVLNGINVFLALSIVTLIRNRVNDI